MGPRQSDTATDASGASRRREERYETSWLVLIAIPGGRDVHATAKDVSRHGAKLSVPAEIELPPVFAFKIIGKSMAARARIMWRRGNDVGVSIEQTMTLAEPKQPPEVKAPAAAAPEPRGPSLGSRHLSSRR